MKGNKSNPRYSRQVVRKEIARRLKAENEVAQLRAQLEQITKEQIAALRKIQSELYK